LQALKAAFGQPRAADTYPSICQRQSLHINFVARTYAYANPLDTAKPPHQHLAALKRWAEHVADHELSENDSESFRIPAQNELLL
jgi:hypothetical protein